MVEEVWRRDGGNHNASISDIVTFLLSHKEIWVEVLRIDE